MGTPKSERISALASRLHPEAVVWHVGGGTIEILAGKVEDAGLGEARRHAVDVPLREAPEATVAAGLAGILASSPPSWNVVTQRILRRRPR
ncbi:MAG: hypothetical protein R3F34_04485 [Planctomycetota bacterium]